MRLIDADALMREFAEFVRESNNSDFADVPTWNDAVSLLGSAPTVDAKPTRHGRWHVLSDDPYDDSGTPKEAGYYRVIDEFGNEYTDLYYAEPRMTPRGIGYWQDSRYMIRAWARMDGEA